MRIFNLRTLFELRKTAPLTQRRTIARLFKAQEKWGLADASGLLWPLELSPNLVLPESESILVFTSSFFRPDAKSMSKYNDFGYLLKIENILEWVDKNAAWPNAVIPCPVPPQERFEYCKELADTRYFPSPARARLLGIEKRTLSCERARSFFQNRGFVCMETPSLVPSGGVETYLNTFSTEYRDHRGQSWKLAMPTSPEFALKKLLAEGHEKIFQFSRSFRNNGELSAHHEPEFLMAEWYRTGGTLENMMHDTQKLVAELARVLGSPWQSEHSWPVFRVDELFAKYAAIDLATVQGRDDFYKVAKLKSTSVVESDDWDALFYKVFFECIEPFLKTQRACFVSYYPVQMGALAKLENGNPFVLRFEGYLEGVEICNGYDELTDSEELQRRFLQTQALRTDISRDDVFEKTMAYGLPPCSGNALGLDRVIALLAGYPEISNLYAVPFLSQFPAGTVAPD